MEQYSYKPRPKPKWAVDRERRDKLQERIVKFFRAEFEKIVEAVNSEEKEPKIDDLLLKGFTSLEACLFSQTGFEDRRIALMRETISSLEKGFLKPEKLEQMTTKDQMQLFDLLNRNMYRSLTFLRTLNSSTGETIKSLGSIEKFKTKIEEKSPEAHDNEVYLRSGKTVGKIIEGIVKYDKRSWVAPLVGKLTKVKAFVQNFYKECIATNLPG